MTALPPIVIAGATASGKSALALDLARTLRARGESPEFICADSVTVYRGFDVGSAKPSKAEREEFRHHLVDVADPREEFTAGDFIRLAIPAIAGIQGRGARPLLVGGTGFYLRALLRGMASNEEENSEQARLIKAELEARAASEGFPALHAEVIRLDPGSAGTVHPNDHYRVIRALQAMRLYEKPWSVLNKIARVAAWRFEGTRFFALAVDKEELAGKIEARTQAMLAQGLEAEVAHLIGSGIPVSAKPFTTIGYKECVETISGKHPASTLAERIAQATRRLAKQQRTWFRSEAGVEWLRPPFRENLLAALSLR
jgi:tRNA dimethylallyltransferase